MLNSAVFHTKLEWDFCIGWQQFLISLPYLNNFYIEKRLD